MLENSHVRPTCVQNRVGSGGCAGCSKDDSRRRTGGNSITSGRHISGTRSFLPLYTGARSEFSGYVPGTRGTIEDEADSTDVSCRVPGLPRAGVDIFALES